MPRKPRERDDGPVFDPVLDEMRAALVALGVDPDAPPSPDPEWDRHEKKAAKDWAGMTVLEQHAALATLHKDLRQHDPRAKAPTSEQWIGHRTVARFAAALQKTSAARSAEVARVEAARVAALAEKAKSRAEERAAARAVRHAPATGDPETGDEPPKPRRKRRGPAVGSIGYRFPGDPRLYDADDY